jgi:hypothetical protein
MKIFYFTVMSALLLIGVQQASSQLVESSDTISMSAFGLKSDTRENAVPLVQKALEACKGKPRPVFVSPKGRYDFWPRHCIERELFEGATNDVNPKRLAILIEQMDGLVVDGNGSDFVFHDRMQPFTIDHSREIK